MVVHGTTVFGDYARIRNGLEVAYLAATFLQKLANSTAIGRHETVCHGRPRCSAERIMTPRAEAVQLALHF